MGKVLEASDNRAILSPDEVAQYLGKSVSWVYKHWQELGGAKLGGSLFFPEKERLYERIFGKTEKNVDVRLCSSGTKVLKKGVQNQAGGKSGRGPQKKGGGKRSNDTDGANRHNLFGVG